MSLEGYLKDTFGEWQRRELGQMGSFGEDTEWYLVLEHIDSLVDGFLILLYCLESIALTHDGHYFQESKYLGQFSVLENIGTCYEDLGLVVHSQHDQGIHQCIGVVRRKDDGSIGRDILSSYLKDASIG